MECEGCHGQVPDGAEVCPDCGTPAHGDRPHGGGLADRAAATVVYRPEALGLPGSVPTYGPSAGPPPGGQALGSQATGLPPGAPAPAGRRGVPGWLWAVIGVVVVGGIGGGAWALLGGDDPEVAMEALPIATLTVEPTGQEPTATPEAVDPTASADPTPAETGPTAAPTATTSDGPDDKPTDGAGDGDADGSALPPLPPFSPSPIDPDASFLVFASDDREVVPAAVTAEPTTAWEADLAGTVIEVDGDDGLVVATVLTEQGISVVALDPATGAERWEAPINGDIEFSSVTLSDTVVVTIDNPGNDVEDVLGLDRDTGDARWRTVATSTEGLSVVTFADGRLGISDAQSFATLDPVTGEMMTLIEGADVRLGRDTVASLDDGVVTVVDRVDGTPVHTTPVGDVGPAAQYAFTDDRVVVHDGAQLWASASTSGAREWDADLLDPTAEVVDIAVLPDDRILVTTLGADGTFLLAPEDGSVLWRTETALDTVGRFDGNLRGVGFTDDQATVLDLADGSRVGGFTDVDAGGSPYAAGIYYALVDGAISAMDLQHCTIIWTAPVEGISDRQAVPGGVIAVHDTTRISLLR